MVFLSISVKDVAIVLNFKMNQVYIAENVCVNKNNLALKCQGKCYLNKKIAESNEESRERPFLEYEERNMQFNITILDIFTYQFLKLPSIQRIDYYHQIYSSSFILDIFRPPKYVCNHIF